MDFGEEMFFGALDEIRWGPDGTTAKFGFIKPEGDPNGKKLMILPSAFYDKTFPRQGSRLTYKVIKDAKTGRPRADCATLV